MSTLLIIDSHALIHRAYHAIPELTTKTGTPTNAIFGYFSMLQKTIIDLAPSYIAAAFDTPTESFRKKLVADYQATRKPTEDKLKVQFDLVKEVIDATGIKRFESPGYEADDTIGTLVEKLTHDPDFDTHDVRIVILTGDKDMFQLVTERVLVLTPQIGFSKSILYGPAEVEAKLGVPPNKVADYKALVGDPSDNYSGLRNIGPKTATKLITEYGSVEQMEERFDAETMTTLRTMKEVATIKCDLDTVQTTLSDLTYTGVAPGMKTALEKYELYSLIPRFFPKKKEVVEKVQKREEPMQEGLF